MNTMMSIKRLALLALGVLSAGSLHAQKTPSSLQDLVGARGSGGERPLQERGYNLVRTDKSGGSAYSHWHESENGQPHPPARRADR